MFPQTAREVIKECTGIRASYRSSQCSTPHIIRLITGQRASNISRAAPTGREFIT